MRIIFILVGILFIFSGCKKGKFTTEPQISYSSVNPNFTSVNVGAVIPEITFHITDAEGDLGLRKGVDTSWIYLKNNLTGKTDSLSFPDLGTSGKRNFKGDVAVSIATVLGCKPIPGGGLHTDTLYFDIYVRDFAKNKSNVITTGDPIMFECF